MHTIELIKLTARTRVINHVKYTELQQCDTYKHIEISTWQSVQPVCVCVHTYVFQMGWILEWCVTICYQISKKDRKWRVNYCWWNKNRRTTLMVCIWMIRQCAMCNVHRLNSFCYHCIAQFHLAVQISCMMSIPLPHLSFVLLKL